jgi:hypothetical protein
MHYKPPTNDNGVEQWVPIVVKNRDYLVGYISGLKLIEELVLDSLRENGVDIDLRGIDLCLDSSRFNNILENDKREDNCSEIEFREYYTRIVEQKMDKIMEYHPDNDDVFDCFLEVECSCGLGIYTFKDPKDVPNKSFSCQICGRTIIDYTNQNDGEFEYDGEHLKNKNKIIEKVLKQMSLKQRIDEEEDENED